MDRRHGNREHEKRCALGARIGETQAKRDSFVTARGHPRCRAKPDGLPPGDG
jgi:hypothetical protein